MNSTIERCRTQSSLMCASVSSLDAGITPCLSAESCMARSESPKVVSRSETDPSLNVSSLTTDASVRPRIKRSVTCGFVPSGLLSRRLQIALQVRRMTELAELGGAAAEEQTDGPVDHQPRPAADAGHQREVVGARGEPRREAPQPHAEHHGHGLVATEVDED